MARCAVRAAQRRNPERDSRGNGKFVARTASRIQKLSDNLAAATKSVFGTGTKSGISESFTGGRPSTEGQGVRAGF